MFGWEFRATYNVAMSRAGVQVEQGGTFTQQGTLAISVLNNATTGTLLCFWFMRWLAR